MKGILIFVFSILILVSCSPQENHELQTWGQPDGKIRVLSTISMINDLVKQIGGDHVKTITLIKGELDPHSYQLVKGDDEKLAISDIIFCNGLGLEHGPSLREYLLKNSKAICLGDMIKKSHPEELIFLQRVPDPHIWMDISLWSRTVPFIVDALSLKDPEHAKEYQLRGEALLEKMSIAHEQMKTILKKVPEKKRYLVTSHDAFNYFARAYLAKNSERLTNSWKDRVAAPEGLAPESQLSTTDIRLILKHIKNFNIRIIFPESNVNQASIRKLMDAGNEEGLRLHIAKSPLYGDAMGAPGSSGDTYLKMIRHNVETIASHLNVDDGDNNVSAH